MKLHFFIALFFSINSIIFAKDVIVKDFDGDGKFDKIMIDHETKKIVFLLSSLDYKKQTSLAFSELPKSAILEETKNGFKFENKIDNIVFTTYFRYNRQTKTIDLTALKRKIVSDDYSIENGESSFITATQEFIGKWLSLDKNSNKVIPLPTLKTKLDLQPILLNDFNDDYLKKFDQQSIAFYKAEISKQK